MTCLSDTVSLYLCTSNRLYEAIKNNRYRVVETANPRNAYGDLSLLKGASSSSAHEYSQLALLFE